MLRLHGSCWGAVLTVTADGVCCHWHALLNRPHAWCGLGPGMLQVLAAAQSFDVGGKDWFKGTADAGGCPDFFSGQQQRV